MIWRRIRIQGNTSMADLHHIIQIAMGWDDEHLHYFHIYGQDYGVYRHGGMIYSQDAEQVFIDDFAFDAGDRFTYIYNFRDWWPCDIRVEAIEPACKPAPRCSMANSGVILSAGIRRWEWVPTMMNMRLR
jgi:hypothetical protein